MPLLLHGVCLLQALCRVLKLQNAFALIRIAARCTHWSATLNSPITTGHVQSIGVSITSIMYPWKLLHTFCANKFTYSHFTLLCKFSWIFSCTFQDVESVFTTLRFKSKRTFFGNVNLLHTKIAHHCAFRFCINLHQLNTCGRQRNWVSTVKWNWNKYCLRNCLHQQFTLVLKTINQNTI